MCPLLTIANNCNALKPQGDSVQTKRNRHLATYAEELEEEVLNGLCLFTKVLPTFSLMELLLMLVIVIRQIVETGDRR